MKTWIKKSLSQKLHKQGAIVTRFDDKVTKTEALQYVKDLTLSDYLRAWFVLSIFSLSFWQTSSCFAAINSQNLNIIGQGIGVLSLSTTLPEQAQSSFSIQSTVSNHYINPKDHSYLFDYESLHHTLRYTRRLKNLQFSISGQFIQLDHGYLDRPIENYHQSLSLPNAGREDRPKDAFSILIQGEEHYERKKGISGLSDIRLGLTKPFSFSGERLGLSSFFKNFQAQHFIQLQVKVPVRDSVFLSSGSYDASLGLSHQFTHSKHHIVWQTQYALNFIGQRSWLNQHRKPIIYSFSNSLSFPFGHLIDKGQLNHRLTHQLILQLDLSSAPYHAKTETLASRPFQKTQLASAAYQYSSKKFQIQAALLEDILPESAPDVGFMLYIQQNF